MKHESTFWHQNPKSTSPSAENTRERWQEWRPTSFVNLFNLFRTRWTMSRRVFSISESTAPKTFLKKISLQNGPKLFHLQGKLFQRNFEIIIQALGLNFAGFSTEKGLSRNSFTATGAKRHLTNRGAEKQNHPSLPILRRRTWRDLFFQANKTSETIMARVSQRPFPKFEVQAQPCKIIYPRANEEPQISPPNPKKSPSLLEAFTVWSLQVTHLTLTGTSLNLSLTHQGRRRTRTDKKKWNIL